MIVAALSRADWITHKRSSIVLSHCPRWFTLKVPAFLVLEGGPDAMAGVQAIP
jgi:hypothetical protein